MSLGTRRPPLRALGALFAAVLGLLPALSLAAFDSASPPASGELTLRRIVPSGEDVPSERQIVFEFDRPIVPIGRMARRSDEIPISITPALDCEWRWLDTSTLACQLGEAERLARATRYHIEVAAGFQSRDGSHLPPLAHTFITARPAVSWTSFRTWRAPGFPVIRLVFNQPVRASSIAEHLHLSPNGADAERIALEVFPDQDETDGPRLIPLPGEPRVLLAGPEDGSREARRLEEPASSWLVAPVHELTLDTTFDLNIEPGLRSEGPEPGVTGRAVVRFDTFPAFAFLGVRCLESKGEKWILLSGNGARELRKRCDPQRGVGLAFNTPVIDDEVRAHLHIDPDLAGERSDYDPWAKRTPRSRLDTPHERGNAYVVWLPEALEAHQPYALRSEPGALHDEFGRALASGIDLRIMTDHRRPRLALTHPNAVLERHADSEIPLYVTNLEHVDLRFGRLTSRGLETGIVRRIEVPAVEDVSFAIPMGVRAMLEGESGVVSGHLTTTPASPRRDERRFFAQVTPYQVHVKLGHFSSLAWVTDLATGEPVADAEVALYVQTYRALGRDALEPLHGPFRTRADGTATLPGLSAIDPDLEHVQRWNDVEPRWFLDVVKGDERAVVPLDSRYRVWSSGAWGHSRTRHGHVRAWGTTAQGIYRAGSIIEYKIFVRAQDDTGFVAPPRESYTLRVLDPLGQEVEKREGLILSAFGTLDGELHVPEDATVGWYDFRLTASFSQQHAWQPLRVLVSEFTPSPFAVRTELAGDRFEAGDSIEVTTAARLHAGGPYVDAQARVTARLRARWIATQHPAARGFTFDSGSGIDTWRELHRSSAALSKVGELRNVLVLPEADIYTGVLQVESAIRDDRGKYVAHVATATYVGRDRFVGLRNSRWVYDEDETARIEALVIGSDGAPVAGVPVSLSIEHEVMRAARVKGAGNAYLTRYEAEWVQVAHCELESAAEASACEFVPADPGTYRASASVHDSRGRTHSTELRAWVRGRGQVLWQQPEDYSLGIIREEGDLKVGDTARFLVRNPYPGARALISVERYGVRRHWVRTFESSTPLVEVPVMPDDVPGFYLSVVVFSPRVEAPPGPDRVDLGKPAFRMGYVEVPVADPYKQLRIAVSPSGERFRPGDEVTVEVLARPANDTRAEPIELAVTVLDEAVFELLGMGESYFDPYRGFYRLDGLDVLNYGLIKQLLGRQRFEKKGASAGGDGGGDLGLRSLFKFVSYWNPSLVTDRDGRASFSFELPDNLTGWRIFVLGATATDRMGLGEARIAVSKPTELRPVMPNQVMAGDDFRAGFSIMNRTESPRTLSVEVSADGPTGDRPPRLRQEIVVAPYERRLVWLPVSAAAPGEIVFTATGGDALDADRVLHRLPVKVRRSLETTASYGTTVSERVTETIAFPSAIYTDVGELSVVLSPSVIGNLAGAFRYLRDYPYECWEQLLGRAVLASHYQSLRGYLPEDLEWPESATLPRETLERAHAFQAPGGGMSYWVPEDAYASPYLSAYTALAFAWLAEFGHEVPAAVEEALHAYLERLLRHDAMPSFYSAGMASTVRAVALAALARRGRASLEDLDTYEPHVPYMSLFGKAHFLVAASHIEGGQPTATAVLERIMAHADRTGGNVQLNEVWDDGFRRLLATPLRTQCAVLSALVPLGEAAATASSVGELSYELVRAITQARGKRDHWENTQENVFCANAIAEFARTYEQSAPDMRVAAHLDAAPLGERAFRDLRDEPQTLSRPIAGSDPGRVRRLTLEKVGEGRLYYATRLHYASIAERAERTNAGIDIRREYSVQRRGSWVLLRAPWRVERGELLRVDIFLSLPSARHFVVVDDPVPGGLEPIDRGLATASAVDAEEGEYRASGASWWFAFSDWSSYGVSRWSFYHRQLRHDAVRFHSDYLPAGNYHLSYTAQAIAAGRFHVLPVHAEEMYDPDVFGKGAHAELVVSEREEP